jgi:hypothetical protein
MPRSISHIAIGVIYHPPGAPDAPVVSHIISCIDAVLQQQPYAGVVATRSREFCSQQPSVHTNAVRRLQQSVRPSRPYDCFEKTSSHGRQKVSYNMNALSPAGPAAASKGPFSPPLSTAVDGCRHTATAVDSGIKHIQIASSVHTNVVDSCRRLSTL